MNHDTTVWELDLTYPGGAVETIHVDDTGRLVRPHQSDTLTLTRLDGFTSRPFGGGIDLTIEDAWRDPVAAAGMRPVFTTTLDRNTTLLGCTTRLEPTPVVGGAGS